MAKQVPQEQVFLAEAKIKKFHNFKKDLDAAMANILEQLQMVRMKIGR